MCRRLQVSSENAFSRSGLQLVSLSLGLSPAVAFSHLSFFGRKDLSLIPELLISLSSLSITWDSFHSYLRPPLFGLTEVKSFVVSDIDASCRETTSIKS